MSLLDMTTQPIVRSKPLPFRLEDANHRQFLRVYKRERPKEQYVPAITAPPMGQNPSEDTCMVTLLQPSPYFNSIHACQSTHLYPKIPLYMSTHLRTVLLHFSDPTCYITTDVLLPRTSTHIASLPPNYPWLFSIDIYAPLPSFPNLTSPGRYLLSTRYFFRDLQGELGARPYVEVTKEENLRFLQELFEEDKIRTGLWRCESESPRGHFEHWKKEYVIRFLKRIEGETPQQFSAIMGNDWSTQAPTS